MDMMNPSWKNPERIKRRRPTTFQRNYPKQAPAPFRQAYQEPYPDMATQVKMVREQLLKLHSTLENIQRLVDSLNLKSPPSSDWVKNLHSLDYRQMMTLLQSPEIQALVETFARDESLKKEEG
ncbi:hypothetical protein [Ammoniphilus sp. YIM 78166]|uniref:hypothetical protein n=1 Tax=Ammoniphilus sp. YIM 78166 TaxID=1644106 RepID=UPI00106F72EA|nr:hypothetical protein [Ammoniphilus sp. YIM 78166]